MPADGDTSADRPTNTPERLDLVRRLLTEADHLYVRAADLRRDIAGIRSWESGAKLTPLGYSLGICLEDVEVSLNRLGGLRHELRDIAGLLHPQLDQHTDQAV